MSFEDVAVKAIAELDRDIRELREKVLKLESTVADLAIECEKLKPPKAVVNRGAWADQWGYKK